VEIYEGLAATSSKKFQHIRIIIFLKKKAGIRQKVGNFLLVYTASHSMRQRSLNDKMCLQLHRYAGCTVTICLQCGQARMWFARLKIFT
jgi:hypothetical protein